MLNDQLQSVHAFKNAQAPKKYYKKLPLLLISLADPHSGLTVL